MSYLHSALATLICFFASCEHCWCYCHIQRPAIQLPLSYKWRYRAPRMIDIMVDGRLSVIFVDGGQWRSHSAHELTNSKTAWRHSGSARAFEWVCVCVSEWRVLKARTLDRSIVFRWVNDGRSKDSLVRDKLNELCHKSLISQTLCHIILWLFRLKSLFIHYRVRSLN